MFEHRILLAINATDYLGLIPASHLEKYIGIRARVILVAGENLKAVTRLPQ